MNYRPLGYVNMMGERKGGTMIQIDVLAFLIAKGPGRTEIELADAIFGKGAYQQKVNQDCRMLVDRGVAERRGTGGQSDPYRYYPKANNA